MKKDEILIEVAWLMRETAIGHIGHINWDAIAEALYENGYLDLGERYNEDIFDYAD